MNNKTKLAIVHFSGMIVSLLVAVLAHYVYDYYPSTFTSLLFPVNESIWEHAKLFVLPIMLVYLIIYFIIGRKFKNYLPATFASLIFMPIFSCIVFQIYLIVAGTHHPVSGIIFSALTFIIAFILSYFIAIQERQIKRSTIIFAVIGVVALIAIMAVFTYYTPKVDWLDWLFMDHENMCYGLIK